MKVPKNDIARGVSESSPPPMSILRCFKGEKKRSTVALKACQGSVAWSRPIWSDNRFFNMRISLNVAMSDPHYKIEMQNVYAFETGMSLNMKLFKNYFVDVTFQTNANAIILWPDAYEQLVWASKISFSYFFFLRGLFKIVNFDELANSWKHL